MSLQSKKILLVASQHGNEYLGERLYAYITKYHPALLGHVDYLLANPRARNKRVRYIESDMNRSYGIEDNTYEKRRATCVVRYIQSNGYQLVLDLHTTTTKQEVCLIVSHATDSVKQYILCSSEGPVVKMPEIIAKHSLIGNCQQAVSVEVNRRAISDELLESLSQSIGNFLKQKVARNSADVFEVVDVIRDYDLAKNIDVVNFELYDDRFYPVLYGENSYKSEGLYLGFKAIKSIKLRYNGDKYE